MILGRLRAETNILENATRQRSQASPQRMSSQLRGTALFTGQYDLELAKGQVSSLLPATRHASSFSKPALQDPHLEARLWGDVRTRAIIPARSNSMLLLRPDEVESRRHTGESRYPVSESNHRLDPRVRRGDEFIHLRASSIRPREGFFTPRV